MHSTNDTYPIDVFGIKKLGISNWQDNFYMPVKGNEFSKIYYSILEKYTSLLCEKNNEIVYNIGSACLYIVHFITDQICLDLQYERLLNAGYEYLTGRDSKKKELAFIINENKKYSKLLFTIPDFRSKIFSPVNFLFDNSEQLLPLFYKFTGFKKNQFALFYGNPKQSEVKYYCEHKNIRLIQIRSLSNLFKSNEKINSNELIILNDIIHDLMSFIKKTHNFHNEKKIQQIQNVIRDLFKKGYHYFTNLTIFFDKLPFNTLLGTAFAVAVNRLTHNAFRYVGKKSIGFSHGKVFCTAYDKVHLTDAISTVSELIVGSTGEAILFRQLAKKHSYNLSTANVVSLQENPYKTLFDDLQKKDTVKNINKIMIIGFPLNNLFYPSFPSHNMFTNLYLEIEIAKLLKKNGYQVFYKAHPDQLEGAEGLFNGIVDKVISAKFEEIYEMADCILFTHSRTSTFGFALLTKKPIVLINVNDLLWYDDALDQVCTRCKVVNAFSDSDGKIQVNKKELLESVATANDNICYDVVHNYAL